MRIKIIKQHFVTAAGHEMSYAVIVDGKPRIVFKKESELKAFLRGVNGERTI